MKTSKTDDSSANGGSVVGLPVDSSLKGSSDEDEEEAGTDSLTCTTKNNGDYCTKKSTPHQSLEERVQELETKLATLSRLLQRRTVMARSPTNSQRQLLFRAQLPPSSSLIPQRTLMEGIPADEYNSTYSTWSADAAGGSGVVVDDDDNDDDDDDDERGESPRMKQISQTHHGSRVPYLESPAAMDGSSKPRTLHQRQRLSFHLLYDGDEENLMRADDESHHHHNFRYHDDVVSEELEQAQLIPPPLLPPPPPAAAAAAAADEGLEQNNNYNNQNSDRQEQQQQQQQNNQHSTTQNMHTDNRNQILDEQYSSAIKEDFIRDTPGQVDENENLEEKGSRMSDKENRLQITKDNLCEVAARIVEASKQTKATSTVVNSADCTEPTSVSPSATNTTSNDQNYSERLGRTSRSNSISSERLGRSSRSNSMGSDGPHSPRLHNGRDSILTPSILLSKDKRNKWLDHLNSFQESNHDVDLQMQEFIKVPGEVEKSVTSGFIICVDSFLYVCTILPIRFLWSCVLLALYYFFKWSKKPAGKFQFHRRHTYQLIQVSIILAVYRFVLIPISISKVYHWIRGQAMLKLYVLIAMAEIFDRLMCSLGQDCLDSLYWNTTRWPRSSRMLISVSIALVYTALHSLILFIHVATLNVAMNSADEALLALLIGGNFAEIKSTVFKKYNKSSLFKIFTSDVCERFKVALFLSLVLLLNFCQGMDSRKMSDYQRIAGIVWISELLCDWLKHAFITKFNFIPASVYPEYGLLLAGDVTGIGHEGVNLDHSHAVVKRLGFAQMPMVCVMARLVRESAKYAFLRMDKNVVPPWLIVVATSAGWALLLGLKLILGAYLQRTSVKKLLAAPQLNHTPLKTKEKQQ